MCFEVWGKVVKFGVARPDHRLLPWREEGRARSVKGRVLKCGAWC